MKSKNSYSRRITKKEADEGFIFVLKSKLSFFPKSNFELSDEHDTKIVNVKTYSCLCKGPELPHNHYYIAWSGLESGTIIEIEKSDSDEDKYYITQQTTPL